MPEPTAQEPKPAPEPRTAHAESATSPTTSPAAEPNGHAKAPLLTLALGALGVVYGDIGTSPLYAMKECFGELYGLEPTSANVLGLVSLFFWSLTLVVVVKYIGFVMRADNRGEGGILSLLALAVPQEGMLASAWSRRGVIVALGLFGSSLLFADGMITPAISVLSAVEGLQITAPSLQYAVIPITLVILVALFLVQKHGTGFVGGLFGPIMILWFTTLAALGLPWILREPQILLAVNPYLGAKFLVAHGIHGFLVLGAVVLCLTGAEALYADMGHFGRRPIRFAWYAIVFPALLLNYFGQGALLIAKGDAAKANPFYLLAPGWFQYPAVVLATAATVIASQALISGAFSLAQQAIQLGFCPRLTIVHTSSHMKGQIYVPEINSILMVACCGLVVAFRESTNLAAAYGIAVMGTMTITSLLLSVVAYRRWNWSLWKAGSIMAAFLIIDLVFLFSNFTKLFHGGWFPLAVAAGTFALMSTWKRGRMMVGRTLTQVVLPLDRFLESLARGEKPIRVPGTAVFMTSNSTGTPVVLMHHFKHNKVLHERIILLSVRTADVPQVPVVERVQVRDLGQGFFQVVASYGFMQTPTITDIFQCCGPAGLDIEPMQASFYLGRETLIISKRPGMWLWRKTLFGVLSRNALSAVAYFDIPPHRVVELGTQIEL